MVDRSVEMRLRLDISNFQRNGALAGITLQTLTARARALDGALDQLDHRQQALASSSQLAARRLRAQDRATQGLTTSTGALNNQLDQNNNHMGVFAHNNDNSARAVTRNNGSINQLTGRLGLAADAVLTLGSAIIPLGAVGAQAIGGLATATTALVLAGGSAVVAFQGVGDAVKAVNAYQLDPTVANLEKAQEALHKLGPDARAFVSEWQDFEPILKGLQRAAAEGWFGGGITDSLDDFARVAPIVEDIFRRVGIAGGDITGDIANSLASGKWNEFLDFLAVEAPGAMQTLSRSTGSLAHGATELWMALDPGNDRFLEWVEDAADGFDRWASSAEGTEDIEAFLQYARENGPEVKDFFLALVDATAQLTQAAAPLGGPTLTVLTKLLEVVADFADSDLGTPFITGLVALRLYTRGLAVATAAQGRFTAMSATTRAAQATTASANLAAQAARPTRLGAVAGATLPTAAILAGAYTLQKAASANNEFVESAEALQDTIDRADFSNYKAQGEDLLKQQQELADRFSGNSIGDAIGNVADPGYYKNAIEGLLGKSDVEEAADELKRLSAEAQNSQASVAALGEAFGMWVAPLDGSARSAENLEGILRRLTPAMQRSGIDAADLAQAYALQQRLQDGTATWIDRATAMGSSHPFDDLIGDLDRTNAKIRESISLTDTWTNSLKRAQGFLSRNAAIDAYQASLDAMNKSIKDNGKSFDMTTTKGRANRDALRGIATSGLAAAEQLKGLNRVKFVDNLRSQFAAAAEKLGLSEQQTRRWMEQLGLLDRTKAKPKVDLDTAAFDSRAAHARAQLDALDGRVANSAVVITTTHREVHVQAQLAGRTPGSSTNYGDTSGGGGKGTGGGGTDERATLVPRVRSTDGITIGTTTSPLAGSFRGSAFRGAGTADAEATEAVTQLTTGMNRFRSELDRSRDSVKGLSKRLDEAQSRYDAAKSRYQGIVGGIRSNLSDPFAVETTGDIWSAGAGSGVMDPLGVLRGDVRGLRRLDGAVDKLRGRGLSGGALGEVDTIEEAQALLGYSRKDLARYERLYEERGTLAGRVGRNIADGAVPELRRLRAEVHGLRQDLKQEEAENRRHREKTSKKHSEDVADSVSGAAAAGAQRRRP